MEDLVDIVSKTAVCSSNVPNLEVTEPFTEEDSHVLREIGRWMKINGEGIYGKFWKVYGEARRKFRMVPLRDTGTYGRCIRRRTSDPKARHYMLWMKYPEN